MVGNDVVDLAEPQCLPLGTHPRFDQRVFAPSELRLLRASATPARLRWMLWAAKESAYKILRKRRPEVRFAPRRIVVEPHDPDAGRMPVHGNVTYAGDRIAFRGVVDGEALHVVADDDAAGPVVALAAVLGCAAEAPSVAVRRLAVAALAERLGVPTDALRIVRQDRIPRLQLHGVPLPIDLSLSHHGRVVGFAALLPCHGGVR
ncbi:MAG: 4'-phosphopantetheinyl transferase superfamily protein [Candidatus Binatia bacterium]